MPPHVRPPTAPVRRKPVARSRPSRACLPYPAVATLPGNARWRALLGHAHLLLLTVQEEMQEYHDQRTETWQESDRGEVFRERLEAIQAAQSAVEEVSF